MHVIAILIGIFLILSVMADIFNTLIATNTSQARWWLTNQVYLRTWRMVRWVGLRCKSDEARERLLGLFPPLGVLLMLAAWAAQQVVGFGLIWWGIGGLESTDSLADAIYYSGVVYFTIGFGELVPSDVVPRVGALVEAFLGVITTALVIGYLPALYSAYSDRETMLMRLDDGSEDRITPTNLVLARSPDGDATALLSYFKDWESWVSRTLETHTTFPMLTLFRSQHRGQNWVTALGLVTDAALHLEVIEETRGRDGYWMLRRSIHLFDQLTQGADLAPYRAKLDAEWNEGEQFRHLYRALDDHGFSLIPFEEAAEYSHDLRRRYDAQLEYLIDLLLTPRGFWGHSIGHVVDAPRRVADPERRPHE